ncbi:MAG: hypothetical protein FWE44_01955 [Defluviitaleaceae bacterium]|nr:hypothetical protein [Defluviitaleaceae bacterium]
MNNKKTASRFIAAFATIAALILAFAFFVFFVDLGVIVIVGIGIVLIGIVAGLGFSLQRSIMRNISTIAEITKNVMDSERVSKSSFNGLDAEFNDVAVKISQINDELNAHKEAENTAQKQIAELTKDIENINDGLARIIRGELRFNAGGFGQRQANAQGIDALAKHLLSLQNDFDALSNSIRSGNVGAGIDSNKYAGDWKKTVTGLNDAAVSITAVLIDLQDAFARLAKGHFDVKMTTTSEYNKLKTSFNTASAALAKNIGEIHSALTNLRPNGRPVGEFPQDFAKIRDAIVALSSKMEDAKLSKPASSTLKAPFQKTITKTISAGDKEKRPIAVNRMSGAYKPKPTSKIKVSHDFLRNDFGKY